MLKLFKWLLPKRYQRLELRLCSYREADKLLSESDSQQFWRLAPEEDTNNSLGFVWLEYVVKL